MKDIPNEIPLFVPRLATAWSRSHKIVGEDDGEFCSDFLLIADRLGRWHAIGIGGDVGDGLSFFHAVGDRDVTKHYPYVGRVYSDGDHTRNDTGHMWAPYAIFAAPDKAYLYYHHYNKETQTAQLRVLESTDGTLDCWIPLRHPDLEDGNVVLARGACRDACIFWDENEGVFFLYYADSGIQFCTSHDLLHWSEPVTVMDGAPAGFVEPESPFVVYRHGFYYLFTSGHDYGRIAVYASRNPRHFGDPETDKLGELNGHAPELVTVDGQDYIACAGIMEAPEQGRYEGARPAETNLSGVYLQELQWVSPQDARWLDVTKWYPVSERREE